MLLNILLVIQIVICVALVGVILLQRSEGGALGMGGGGAGGFMTARGAGNLLTRTTAILATFFFIVSFGLTILGNTQRSSSSVTDRLDIDAAPTAPGATPAPAAPVAAPEAPADTGPSLDDLAAPLPSDGAAPAEPAPAAKN